MAEIYLLFKHIGIWVELGWYHEKGSFGIMVPSEVSFASLMQIIYAYLRKSPSTHTIGVSYAMAGAMIPVEITNDDTLKGYLYLRRRREDDMEKLQLILEIKEKPSGLDSPRVGSTRNSRDSGCDGNPLMPSIPEEGCDSVPTHESAIRSTLGLDDIRLSDNETQQQRRDFPPRNPTPPPPRRNSPPQPPRNSMSPPR